MIASAQDLFISFDRASNATTTNGDVGTSGSFFILSDQPFAFDALDLDIATSDSSVLLLTGGTAFNGFYVGNPIVSRAFNAASLTLSPDSSGNVNGDEARLFLANITEFGIIPVAAEFHTEFEAGPGSGNGAIVLAEVNYDIVGSGAADLTLSLGAQGALSLPDQVLNPTLGSAFLVGVAAIPEPSTATLLVLSAVGMVAGRRRARS